MAKSNVTQFAEELKLPVTLLLEQLQAAGVKKKAGDDALVSIKATRVADSRCLQFYGENMRLKRVKK